MIVAALLVGAGAAVVLPTAAAVDEDCIILDKPTSTNDGCSPPASTRCENGTCAAVTVEKSSCGSDGFCSWEFKGHHSAALATGLSGGLYVNGSPVDGCTPDYIVDVLRLLGCETESPVITTDQCVKAYAITSSEFDTVWSGTIEVCPP